MACETRGVPFWTAFLIPPIDGNLAFDGNWAFLVIHKIAAME
jgi:hypothetical protein